MAINKKPDDSGHVSAEIPKTHKTLPDFMESTKYAANAVLNDDNRLVYDLVSLFEPKNITTPFVHSKDEDFFMGVENPFSGEEIRYPDSLKKSREGLVIWNMVRYPIKERNQILGRQDFIRNIHDHKDSDEFIAIKNGSYGLLDGVGGLFSIVVINDMHLPLIEAYVRGLVPYSRVQGYFGLIRSGHEYITSLIGRLESFPSDQIRKVAEQLRSSYADVSGINEEYILSPQAKNITKRVDRFYEEHLKVAILIEVAHITKVEGLSFAAYDTSKPAEWKRGWYMVEGKENWIPNDSTRDDSLILLTGSNMSGKSSYLKTAFFMQCMAQSFGVVPCKSGNFHIHDSFFYIDRSSTDHEYDLSAFGDGINTLKNGLKTFRTKPYGCYDEIFSETGPEDQYSLAAATIIHMKSLGAKIYCASHNEKFIELCDHLDDVGIYHLKVKQNEGVMQWLYELEEGVDDSHALEVARTLGLREDILRMAENYLKGEYEDISIDSIRCHEAKKTINRRNAPIMDRRNGLLHSIIRASGSDDGLVHIFSDDSSFKENTYRGSPIFTGLRDLSPERFGGLKMLSDRLLSGKVLQMLLNSPMISEDSFMKRKELFSEIVEKVDFEKTRADGNRLRLFLYFIGFINSTGGYGAYGDKSVMRRLHGFNKLVFPSEYQASDEMNAQLEIFLELNKEIMGETFPFGRELQFTKKSKAIFERIKIHQYSKSLGMPDDSYIENLVSRKHDLYPSEEGFKTESEKEYSLLIEALGYMGFEDFGSITFQELEQAFDKISREAEISSRNPVNPKIFSYARAIMDYLAHKRYQLNNEVLDNVGYCSLIEELKDEISMIKPEPEDYYRAESTLETVSDYMSCVYDHVKHMMDHMPDISIFDTDIRSYQSLLDPLLEKLIAEYKDGDYRHDDNWPTKLIACVLLMGFSQSKNLIDRFMEDFDKLESELGKKISRDFRHALKSDIREVLRSDFGDSYQEFASHIEKFDIYEVCRLKFRLENDQLSHDYKSFMAELDAFHADSKRRGHLLIEEMDHILSNKDKQCPDGSRIKELVGKYLHKNKHVYGRIGRENNFEDDIMNPDFYKELGERRQMLAELAIMAMDIDKRHGLLSRLSRRFGSGADHDQMIDELKNGDFSRLIEMMKLRLDHFIQTHPINAPISDITALTFYGEVSEVNRYGEFSLNARKEIDIREMFNIFTDTSKQVRNTDSFKKGERGKILTGTNMSGKTFNLKALAMSAITGKVTGKTTGTSGSMPDIDKIIYMDRVVSKSDKSLSSFGNEVMILNKIISIVDEGKDILLVVDEMLSTTSPKYQAALVYAIIVYILKKDNHVAMASHNHEVVDVLCRRYGSLLKAYHNKVEFDKEGKLRFDFRLQEGHAPSNAIHVAEKMGLPDAIIRIAKSLQMK